jgi:hypothetical protein
MGSDLELNTYGEWVRIDDILEILGLEEIHEWCVGPNFQVKTE